MVEYLSYSIHTSVEEVRYPMPLNIKNPVVERLADEVAQLTGESKTEAIRKALEERRARLNFRLSGDKREERLRRFLEHEIWPIASKDQLGKRLSHAEEGSYSWVSPGGGVILDTSAIVAIALKEPSFEELPLPSLDGDRVVQWHL